MIDICEAASQCVPHATSHALTFLLPVLLQWDGPQKVCKTQPEAILAASGTFTDSDQMLSFPSKKPLTH